jgi:serine/threonine protein kinase
MKESSGIITSLYNGMNLIKYKLNTVKDNNTFKEFLLNIKEYFKNNNNTIHKARNELKVISYNNTDTVVKAFRVPNIINRIAYTFLRDSKAKKSYEYSLKIKEFTPEPIGYIEFFDKGLLSNSYFVSEKFDYDFTIREPLLDDDFLDKEHILRAFAKFTFDLHENDIFHNDYSPGNILIKKEGDHFLFKIVDINRMKFYTLDSNSRARNFSKLWARDDELKIMADEYLKYYKTDMNFTQKVCEYSQKNKDVKNFKKRLKGQEAND